MGSLAGRWSRRLVEVGPWLVLPAVAIVIAARWDAWPRVYPVHFGLREPARLVERSMRSVAAPLAVAAALLAWLEAVRAHVLRYADPTLDRGRTLRLVASGLRAVQWTLAVMSGAVALPSAHPALAAVAWGAALTLVPLSLAVGEARGAAPAPRGRPPPGGWLYVPRAIGFGLAIARGHPAAQRAWLLLLGPPLAILALARLFLA
ncbi:hypothetical protein [Anaeromyxobacter diazotrophicus]|uniref:DUF1648 domain-containing protein n=1 Tax=Anaeromyxobacter diazotrophicus TaxID=2590199 RepID=A0A7I9VR38_9BACT|nr:hypothetical protein [Anaeromyxobacter diazotrophicus]GEJ58580.1 hypothetical protein AMYX_33210 [Anaeromyxobacter diazotrophicus]